MKQVWLILLIILAERQNLPGQQITADLKSASGIIALDNPGKNDVLRQQISFSGVRFLDNRIDTSSVGFIERMPAKYPDGIYRFIVGAKLHFRRPLTDEFNQYVNKAFSGSFCQAGDSLLVVINNFRISEETDQYSDQNPQFVKFSLFFARKSHLRFSIMGVHDTLLMFKRRAGQEYYEEAIKLALKEVILKANALVAMNTSSSEMAEIAFEAANRGRYTIPLLQNIVLKRGAYANFQEVLTNSPKYVHYEPTHKDFASYAITVKNSDGAVVRWKDLWGYSDGKDIYVFGDGGKTVYPLVMEGNSLTISLRSPDTATDNAALRAANAFLFVAAVLTRTNSSINPVSASVLPPILYEKVGKKRYLTVGTEINMQTGEIEF